LQKTRYINNFEIQTISLSKGGYIIKLNSAYRVATKKLII